MTQILLDAALAGTRSRAQAMLGGEPLQRAFLAWLHPGLTYGRDWSGLAAELAGQLKAAGRSAQAVAALGFLVGAGHHDDAATRDAFLGGMRWIMGRTVAGSASSVALAHPVLLLGMVVGTLACDDAAAWNALRHWHASLSDQLGTPHDDSTPRWQLELGGFVRQRLTLDLSIAPALTTANKVLLALARRGLLTLELGQAEAEAAAMGVLGALLRVDFVDAEDFAFGLAAYEHLAATSEHPRLRAPELHDVALALSRLQAALRRWTWEDAPKVVGGTARKWHVDHEYHFQNLLTAVFVPLFSDLKDEEWLASLGPKKPRADLVVPSLKLVIEVKFWRAGVQASAMVSQIAEDVGLYRKRGSPYLYIVPVIWDDGARVEQHAHLISGLNELEGVLHPTIVSRPAAMVDDDSPVKPAKKARAARPPPRKTS